MQAKTAIYYSEIMAAASMNLQGALPKKLDLKSATIKLTENCNSRCRTCDYWHKQHEELITTERAIRLLGEMREMGVEDIRFAGGEPLMRGDFFEVLKSQPQDAFRKVIITTNGLLLKERRDAINDSIITDIGLSIDGIGETNDKIRGVPGYYDNAMTELEKIKGKRITIMTNLSSLVIPELEQLIGLCKDRGYGFSLNILDSNIPFLSGKSTRKNIKSMIPTEEDMDRARDPLLENNVVTPLFFERIKRYYATGEAMAKHCILGFFSFIVLSNGDVLTGCYLFKPPGNILENSLSEVVNYPRFEKNLIKGFRHQCPKCTCGIFVSILFENPLATASFLINRKLRS